LGTIFDLSLSIIFSIVSLIFSSVTFTYYLQLLLKKPKLEVEFDYSKLDYIDSASSSTGGSSIVYKTVRVKVTNNGKATAEECIAKAEIMANESSEHKDVKPSNLLEPVILHWTRNLDTLTTKLDPINHSNEDKFERLFKPINIAVGDYEFADLIIIGKEEGLGAPPEEHYAIVRCNLNPNITPMNYNNLRLKSGEIIRVIIYCSNCNSKPLCLKVKKVPATLNEISRSNKDDYFEEDCS